MELICLFQSLDSCSLWILVYSPPWTWYGCFLYTYFRLYYCWISLHLTSKRVLRQNESNFNPPGNLVDKFTSYLHIVRKLRIFRGLSMQSQHQSPPIFLYLLRSRRHTMQSQHFCFSRVSFYLAIQIDHCRIVCELVFRYQGIKTQHAIYSYKYVV